jgi:heavy metal sensor kinase
MSSARNKPLGLRTRLTLWTTLVLAVSFAAGFAWVHYGLRLVLEARNDAFLEQKAAELIAGVTSARPQARSELQAEIEREVEAYAAEGLIVVVREADRRSVAPRTDVARRLADQDLPVGPPRTIVLPKHGGLFRVYHAAAGDGGVSLELAISLVETKATLAAFDRRVAWGALVFLLLAVAGGFFLSRQALRPVSENIRSARRLDPENLSERLPTTGSGDELDELAGTINGLLDRLATYHARAVRFTADASHELRSPLGAMRAAVEVALQKPRGIEEYRSTLASLGEQCDRLTTLVNGLQLLARADAGEVVLARETVDLTSLVGEVVDMFDPIAEEAGVSLTAEDPGPLLLTGDPSRLRQLATNLLDNALRFTARGGSVSLRVERDAQRATLRVRDTGQGIPAEHLLHVFERFYQADAARALGGCGLGLSICRWIVKAHGGSIGVTSAEGKGTVFTVELPLAEGAATGGPLASASTGDLEP